MSVPQLDLGGQTLALERACIMGVLNVTPDSFSDGGLFIDSSEALAQARRMVDEGAAIIDVGGESTRPGSEPVSVQQELDRVLPVIEGIRSELPAIVSIDTSKPEVMRAAVRAGARMINDVFALRAPGALSAAAECGVAVCLMHMQGEPRTMQIDPGYDDVVREVREFLAARRDACLGAGIPAARIVVDPGFGFGKTVEHNLELLRSLRELCELGAPLLVGLSRKSTIGRVLGLPLQRRLHASIALAVLAWQGGARLLRVHDVGPTVEAIRMCEAVAGMGAPEQGDA